MHLTANERIMLESTLVNLRHNAIMSELSTMTDDELEEAINALMNAA